MLPRSSIPKVEYIIEEKWYPGFNDYPLGEDFDYNSDGFEVIQEWITGGFNVEVVK